MILTIIGIIVLLLISIYFCGNAYFALDASEEGWRYMILTIQTFIIVALIGCILMVLGGCV